MSTLEISLETKRRLLLSKWRTEQEAGIEHICDVDELKAEHAEEIESLEQTLVDVRYWLHDGIVLNKIVSDPRALLRKVEGVLG